MIEAKICPVCKSFCEETGELTVNGVTYPVVECIRCVVPKSVFGQAFECPRLFLVQNDGSLLDPDTLAPPA